MQTEETEEKPDRPSRWQRAFLKALAETGVVTQACEQAKISRFHAYRQKKADQPFADKWADALEAAADKLESEIVRRAFAGSDLLLIFQMKSLRPERYRDKFSLPSKELDALVEKELAIARGQEQSQEQESDAVN